MTPSKNGQTIEIENENENETENINSNTNTNTNTNTTDVEMATISDEATDGDTILEPMSLIDRKTFSLNFNQLCANYNSASIWRRDKDSFYGWGDNEEGNIGDEQKDDAKSNDDNDDIDGNNIAFPTSMTMCNEKMIRSMSIGENHTAFIQPYGGLYVFGCNEDVCVIFCAVFFCFFWLCLCGVVFIVYMVCCTFSKK